MVEGTGKRVSCLAKYKNISMKIFNSSFLIFNLFCISHSNAQTISQQANTILIKDTAISKGHIGICIYEPAANKYWYNYNATKYFVPASNTKLFSLYAGMKYLGDSLIGLRYENNDNGEYFLYPTADPTFLHPDFKNQAVFSFLKKIPNQTFIINAWKTNAYGNGWAWDDYNDYYMAERSIFPMYGNTITFLYKADSLIGLPYGKFAFNYSAEYEFEQKQNLFLLNNKKVTEKFSIKRNFYKNIFDFTTSDKPFEPATIPFIADTCLLSDMLMDTLHIGYRPQFITRHAATPYASLKVIHSQPSDSVFKPMMHRSDNFFAEQTLLMASNEFLGYVDEKAMIDTLLKSSLKDIPQKPQWVDGSGLSRSNLFTPQSFVYILNKMKNEFGLERLKTILPTGGKGTLKNYYKNEAGYIFAKTGTLSNNVALSGYLFTKKGKLLIFSVLAGNYQTTATPIRKAVEKFLVGIREKN
jgi:D-alanyl-D-alanine carboxypeptidase/D-alanyl-D-alanine-endopeptidase (penicillin-binding protein 4)